jgi:RecJ-like exonuclease
VSDIVERLLTIRDCRICDGEGNKADGRICTGCDGAGKVLSLGSIGKEAADEIERLRSPATQHHQGGDVTEAMVIAACDEFVKHYGHSLLGLSMQKALSAALAQQPLPVRVTDAMVEAGCIERYQRWALISEDEKNNARLKMRRWIGAALKATGGAPE